MIRRLLPPGLWLVAVFAVLAPRLIIAAESGLLPGLASLGWEEILFDGKPSNRYAACGEDCVEIKSDASVSMIGKPVSVDLSERPVLTWQWQINAPVAATDLATRGKDDRAVAVYVTFPYDPKTATLMEKLLRPIIELIRGSETPGRMLSYVWSGYGRHGDVIESPYYGDINAMVISRNGTDPVGSWIMERFDVVADHQRAFGFPPRAVAHVLVGADTDDTATRSLALVRNIVFTPR